MKDELGNRIKTYYENRTRFLLPRRTYTMIRLDGKSFHSYVRGLVKPFDMGLIEDMDATACYLCKNIQGAKFAFVQSDEISILLTDFDKMNSDAWFDGNIQKIASISASLATAEFNKLRMKRNVELMLKHSFSKISDSNETVIERATEFFDLFKLATFDARVFTIPSKIEVANTIIWRQQDTVRNSISSVAQSLYSHKELNEKTTSDMQEMIHEKGDNWNNYDAKLKRGRFIEKKEMYLETPFVGVEFAQHSYVRNTWVSSECPTFTQEPDFLLSRIPENI